MNNKTKIILTVIGLAAIIVPAVLLYVLTSNKASSGTSSVSSGSRQINAGNIQNEINSNQPPAAMQSPNPSPLHQASASATPKSGSPVINISESTPASH